MKKLNQRGQILIFVTLGFVMLGLFVGMAIDFGRGYLERARISRTVDAMALAAARALLGSSAPSFEDAAVAAGCGAASMNGVTFSSCSRTTPLGPAVNPSPGDPVGCAPGSGALNVTLCFVSKNVSGGGAMNFVQVSGHSSIPTTFLRLLTFVGAGDYTTLPVAAVAEGGPDRPVDLMLVLDRSGSMSGQDGSGITKIQALICTLTGSCPAGKSSPGFLNVGFTDNDKIGVTSFSNRGCGVVGGSSVSEFTGNVCTPDVPLALYNSSQQSSITSAINNLTAQNLTNTMEGLRTAIPQMTAAFADASRASRKAVLLITDGQPTAIRLSSIEACQEDPGNFPLTTGNNTLADSSGNPLAPWTDNNGCWFKFSAPGLRRQQLNSAASSPNSNITTTTPALAPAQLLYQHMMSATRNAPRDEAYQLRALGGGNVIVFVIGIGIPNAPQPDYRLDANARCLLGLIANDPDIINDLSPNPDTGGCAAGAVHQTSTGSNDVDPHADLRQTTPGGTQSRVEPGQMNGKLFTVDLNGDVTAQLQDIFGQIAAILKLRLTI